jgi:hypothetical protein
MYGGDSMKMAEYRVYLKEQDFLNEAIEERLALIGDFVGFFREFDPQKPSAFALKEVVDRYAHKLIDEDRNTLVNLLHLRDYAGWLDHRPLYVAWIELLDCYNAFSVLADTIERTHGREIRKRIFNKPLPPLGASEGERCAYMQSLTGRMEQEITPEEARQAWFQV